MPKLQIWLLLVEIDFYFKKTNQLRNVKNDVTSMELSLTKNYKKINIIKFLTSVIDNSDQTVFFKKQAFVINVK